MDKMQTYKDKEREGSAEMIRANFTSSTFGGKSRQEDSMDARVQELVLKSTRKTFMSKAFQPVNLKKPINLGPAQKQSTERRAESLEIVRKSTEMTLNPIKPVHVRQLISKQYD